jgi:hypothetical protein
MAGSYNHVVDRNNNLIPNEKFPDMIENLGDAYETIEEMYHMIDILARGSKTLIAEAHYKYLERVDGDVEIARKMGFWESNSKTWDDVG